MGEGHRLLIGAQDDLAPLLVDVEGAQDEEQPREGRVARDGLEPVVVDVEEDHLVLGRGARWSAEGSSEGRGGRVIRVSSEGHQKVMVQHRPINTIHGTHLRLGGLEDQVAEALDFQAALEGEL